MDKTSAVLIFGIVALLAVNGVVIYNTWLAEDDLTELVMENRGEQATAQEIFIFNDDTSITNNSHRTLWIRAKAAENGAGTTLEVVSRYINEEHWIMGKDGWYYYRDPIGFAQSTMPLAEEVRFNGSYAAGDKSGRFRLNVEAVDDTWLSAIPKDGQEAFRLFRETEMPPGLLYL